MVLSFLPGCGTVDALSAVVNHISDAKYTNSKRKATAVFLDLQKAFKMADPLVIQDSMVAGLGGHMVGWVQDFLQNRRSRVKFQGVVAKYKHFVNAPPLQGSCLSPMLFNMLIN